MDTRCKLCFGFLSQEKTIHNGDYYHPTCLVCTRCNCVIKSEIGEANGKFYCAPCYRNHVLQKCYVCSHPITGQYYVAFGMAYHGRCFRCHHCDEELVNGQYVAAGGEPFCPACYEIRKSSIERPRSTSYRGSPLISRNNPSAGWSKPSSQSFRTPKPRTSVIDEPSRTSTVSFSTPSVPTATRSRSQQGSVCGRSERAKQRFSEVIGISTPVSKPGPQFATKSSASRREYPNTGSYSVRLPPPKRESHKLSRTSSGYWEAPLSSPRIEHSNPQNQQVKPKPSRSLSSKNLSGITKSKPYLQATSPRSPRRQMSIQIPEVISDELRKIPIQEQTLAPRVSMRVSRKVSEELKNIPTQENSSLSAMETSMNAMLKDLVSRTKEVAALQTTPPHRKRELLLHAKTVILASKDLLNKTKTGTVNEIQEAEELQQHALRVLTSALANTPRGERHY